MLRGSIHTRKWQDKTTGKIDTLPKIKASVMQLLDNRSASGNNQNSDYNNDYNNNGNYGSYGQDDYQSLAQIVHLLAQPPRLYGK